MMLKEEKRTMSQSEIIFEMRRKIQDRIKRENITPEQIQRIKEELRKWQNA